MQGISKFLKNAAKQAKLNPELDVFGSGNMQRLVEAVKLTPHYQWQIRDVAGVLYSLSCLRKQMSNKAEAALVAELLSYMTGVISSSTKPFNAIDLSQSFFGLRKLSDTFSEVRALLSALASKVRECRKPLDAQAVGNALYGLQGCSSDSAEVREVLSALAAKVRECREPLDAQAVGNALYGLQGKDMCPELHELVGLLRQRALDVMGGPALEKLSQLPCSELISLQQVFRLLPGDDSVVVAFDGSSKGEFARISTRLEEELKLRQARGEPLH